MGVNPTDREVARMIRIKANKLVGKYGYRRCDVPDIEQDLALHLVERGEQLIAHTAAQKTVLDQALRNAISNLIEKRCAKKRDSRRDIHIDAAPEQALLDSHNETDELIDRMDVDEAIAALPEALQPLATELRGCKPAEARRELDLTRGGLRHQMKVIGDHFSAGGLSHPNSQSGDDSGQ